MPYFGQLFNFACWLCGDRAAAEDLVQETYMKALKGFSSFTPGTNLRAWMYRILRNTYLTTQAGLKAAPLDDEDEQQATDETPESILLAHAERQQLERALEALPVHHREIVLLCDVEEMSYQEIGQTLGIPIGTVMSRLSRARRALRQLLAGQGEEAAR